MYIWVENFVILQRADEWRDKTFIFLEAFGSGRYKDIFFTDEKIFSVEEFFNKQNNRVYVKSSFEVKDKVPRVQRGHHPSYVMVW